MGGTVSKKVKGLVKEHIRRTYGHGSWSGSMDAELWMWSWQAGWRGAKGGIIGTTIIHKKSEFRLYIS